MLRDTRHGQPEAESLSSSEDQRLRGPEAERLRGWEVERLRGWEVERLRGIKVTVLQPEGFYRKTHRVRCAPFSGKSDIVNDEQKVWFLSNRRSSNHVWLEVFFGPCRSRSRTGHIKIAVCFLNISKTMIFILPARLNQYVWLPGGGLEIVISKLF